NGAIISADSRQVYRGMDIGTGKDLEAYGEVPHYLIDLLDAGETYHVTQYQVDFHHALQTVRHQGKQPILCGGSGLYIQSVLQPFAYSTVPVNDDLRNSLNALSRDALLPKLQALPIPPDFQPGTSTKKRLNQIGSAAGRANRVLEEDGRPR